ncbi:MULTISPECIES: hypothetical protein [unclassified Enterococcus]|uniref:hypothetical protein n=1 Tax=unclassified Enterococcus TaxID=2608891 RepID=UPI003D281CA3
MNLQTEYVGDFNEAGNQNRKRAQKVMNRYESLKEYNTRQEKRTDTVPKTNPTVVAFDTLKGQGMKEASVNNQQKKRNESIVQEKKKAFEK